MWRLPRDLNDHVMSFLKRQDKVNAHAADIGFQYRPKPGKYLMNTSLDQKIYQITAVASKVAFLREVLYQHRYIMPNKEDLQRCALARRSIRLPLSNFNDLVEFQQIEINLPEILRLLRATPVPPLCSFQ